MSDYDDVLGVADSRGKLVKSLEDSIELFKYLQGIVKLDNNLKEQFKDSIDSIDKSIKIVKEMKKENFTKLIKNMNDANHRSKF